MIIDKAIEAVNSKEYAYSCNELERTHVGSSTAYGCASAIVKDYSATMTPCPSDKLRSWDASKLSDRPVKENRESLLENYKQSCLMHRTYMEF